MRLGWETSGSGWQEITITQDPEIFEGFLGRSGAPLQLDQKPRLRTPIISLRLSGYEVGFNEVGVEDVADQAL